MDRLPRGHQASGTFHLLKKDSLPAAASHSAAAAPALMAVPRPAAPKTPCSDRFLPPQVLQIVIFHILFHLDFLMASGGHLTCVSCQWILHALHQAHQRSLQNLIHLVWALNSLRAILQSNHNSATKASQSWEECPHSVCTQRPQKPGGGSVAVRKRLGSSASSADTCYSSCWRSAAIHISPQTPPFSHATCRGTVYKRHGEGMNEQQTPTSSAAGHPRLLAQPHPCSPEQKIHPGAEGNNNLLFSLPQHLFAAASPSKC